MNATTAPPQSVRAPRPPLRGVGGWLALFIFGTVFLGVLFGVQHFSFILRDLKAIETEFPRIRGVAVAYLLDHVAWFVGRCYGIYAGWLLWKIRPGAVDATKRFLVLTMLLAFVQAVAFLVAALIDSNGSWSAMVPTPVNSYSQPQLVTFVDSLAYATVWYAYFVRSGRVQNTYADS